MCIYIVLLVYIIALSIAMKMKNQYENTKKTYLFLCFLPLTLIACLRSTSVGIDTLQFTNAFDRIALMTPKNFELLRYEYGFIWLCWLLSKLFSNSQILIITTSLFINYSVAKFIEKNSENVYLSTILFVTANFYFCYMNIMRQALAISILLFGFEYLKKEKYIKYLIFVLLASLFHTSAILAGSFIFFRKFKFNRKFIIISILIAVLAFAFGRQFFALLSGLSPRLAEYANSSFATENYFGSLLDFLVYAFIFLFGAVILLLNDRDVFKNKNNNLNILVGLMGAAVVFYALVMKVIIFNRFTHYFSIFSIIWISNCLMKVKNAKDRFYLSIIVSVLFIIYWLVIMIYRPKWYGVIPYELFFR